MNIDHNDHVRGLPLEWLLVFFFAAAVGIYIGAAITSSRRKHLRPWPIHRLVLWVVGVCCAAAAVIGPLAQRAHLDFTAHMAGHLLLGMLAPLLLVLAAPMTLLLRSLPVGIARRLARLLESRPMRMLSHPVIASVLHIGGLWLLYTTDLYMEMQKNLFLHAAVHVHLFVAGYLFTGSILYVDPTPRRLSFGYRAVVLGMALAGHGILSKTIYAVPPPGVAAAEGRTGAMLMYYGGDAIDLVLIFFFCLYWYKAARPRFVGVKIDIPQK